MKKVFFLVLFFCVIIRADASNNMFKVTLVSCIDGDTAKFNVKGEVKTVRFLSINTPEIAHDDIDGEPFGDVAKDYTCKLLKSASTIKLQYDSKSDIEDKYGRILAWVFVDNELLQEKLVSEGLAQVKYVYDDYKYSSHLKDVEFEAKNRELGIWSSNIPDKSSDNRFYMVILFMSFVAFCCLRWIYFHILKK